MNNDFSMIMPGLGYGYRYQVLVLKDSGKVIMLDAIYGFLGRLSSLSSTPSNQGLGSDYNFNYGYDSNFDYNYGNEFPSDLPVEDLRSFDSSMGVEQSQYSFQNDYDFSQNPLDDFASNLNNNRWIHFLC